MTDLPSQTLLDSLGCKYAFYFNSGNGQPVFYANHERFFSASMIKVPILLAWLRLEKAGVVDRAELCRLDDEEQVQGAGFSWLLRARQIPFQDALLLMIAVSDNLCTNLVIRRAGLERLNQVFHEDLGLEGTALERKLFDYEARARGKDNWISARDCIRMYQLIHDLDEPDRAWVESMLAVNQDMALLMRNIPRDTLVFYHKTGNITGVLHDWGYTSKRQIFLLAQEVTCQPAAFEVFGKLGRMLIE